MGYSGHERGSAVSTVASAIGASIVERHLTLDRTMDGPDHAASLEPQGFQKMVRDIYQVRLALGAGEEKFISRGEILNREVMAKVFPHEWACFARDISPTDDEPVVTADDCSD